MSTNTKLPLGDPSTSEFQFTWKDAAENHDDQKRLVGRVISTAKIGLSAVREHVKAAWKVKSDLDVNSMGTNSSPNMFSFTFSNVEEAQRPLAKNPWVVRQHILTLQKRSLYSGDNEIQIDTCRFWIQLHNIPPEGRMAENYRMLAEKVGRVNEIENPGVQKLATKSFGRC